MANKPLDRAAVVGPTKKWVETMVVGLNFCPFARAALQKESIRFSLVESTSEQELLAALSAELSFMRQNADIETSLLIHPQVLVSFHEYNQFLQVAEALLEDLGFAGELQIASFHPDYQFAGTMPEDAENYTNKSPFPMLHILREESLSKVLQNYSDPEAIPEQNIKLLQEMGAEEAQAMLHACRSNCPE